MYDAALCARQNRADTTQLVLSITLVRSWQETDLAQIVQINGLIAEGGVRVRGVVEAPRDKQQ